MHDGEGVRLTVGGWTMYGTGIPEHRGAGLETLERLRGNHPERAYEFREYRAAMHKIENDVCTGWSEEAGWSIWYC